MRDGLALTAIVLMTEPGLVVVDKPAGMTSHDVVGRCRRIFGTRKVGHAGTLDPMATGVLVVGIERATKILGLLTATDKSYAATIRLGQTTSTEDAEGEVLQTVSAAGVTDTQIEAAVAALRGDIDQIPSAVSAIKVGGKRAYKLAREGQTVELAPRRVRIDRFDVLAVRRRRRLRRRGRRGGLFLRHLHPRAGPRRRRGAGRRWTPHRAAAHPGRSLRAGAGRTPWTSSPSAAADLLARRGVPADRFRVAT